MAGSATLTMVASTITMNQPKHTAIIGRGSNRAAVPVSCPVTALIVAAYATFAGDIRDESEDRNIRDAREGRRVRQPSAVRPRAARYYWTRLPDLAFPSCISSGQFGIRETLHA